MEEQETAIIPINPQLNEAIVALEKQAQDVKRYALLRHIASDDDVKVATNDLSIISNLKKAIEEKRQEYILPISTHLKAVNEAFKLFAEPLMDADKITREKILDYRSEQQRQRQEADDIAALEREAAERRAALTGEPVVLLEETQTLPATPAHYHAEMGSLGKMAVYKWEVIDFSLVPDHYKIVDAGAITRVAKASKGRIAIPGIRVWAEETLRVTAKKDGDQ